MEPTHLKPMAAKAARWTFSSLAAVPDVETGTPTGAPNNNGGSIIGFILLFDVLIRCFSSLAYALNLPPIVVAPCVCILVVGMIVVVVVAVSNAS
jgi:hypothetical protein